jgi:hypothetical protein
MCKYVYIHDLRGAGNSRSRRKSSKPSPPRAVAPPVAGIPRARAAGRLGQEPRSWANGPNSGENGLDS